MVEWLFEIFNLLAIIAIVFIPFLKTKGRAFLTIGIISLQTFVNFLLVYKIFAYGPVEYTYPGSWITGPIAMRIDALSAWFISIISFTFFTGAWYGLYYMKHYSDQPYNLALHEIAFLFTFTALIDICVVQNSLVFLVIWEIMTMASFIVIIFDHQKTETIKAGINFLIQSHIGILFLTIAFIWMKVKTGTFDLQGITTFTAAQPALTGIGLFIFFFIGFGIKAGFFPFHTWLPLAHPAAPAHISGIMSGVIIKIGIYGIFRILTLIKTDIGTIGYILLFISVITGIYGVMLAIIQHNLKKLLAYHSIENIGIIGIGIGLGCLGLKFNNQFLEIAGFGGALLHTLNHSLFKSLLFFTSGNVYHTSHTMNIDSLGGLIKKIPQTAYLFLIGSLAICGLPPFNGFVSEFFIYSGLFKGLVSAQFGFILSMLFTMIGLVLIGGLALICFTKAFGIVFLGIQRQPEINIPPSEKFSDNLPLYIIALFIVLIGLFPVILQSVLLKTTALFSADVINAETYLQSGKWFKDLTIIGWYSLGFIALALFIYLIRCMITLQRKKEENITWACGYTGDIRKMQYTASSFIRSYRKLAEPVLLTKKKKTEAVDLFPTHIAQHTHPEDKVEFWLIDKPIYMLRRFLNRFIFLQNGNIQAYLLYGFLFIGLAVLVPVFIEKIMLLIKFLNQL